MKDLTHPSQHRTWVEIDLSAIAGNVRLFREAVGAGCQVMPSVAANACGHGIVQASRAALSGGASRLAVATCREGQTLREAGIGVPVQMVGACLPEEVETAIRYNLTISLHDLDTARLAAVTASRAGRAVPVHMEIDCGGGSLGFSPGNAPAAAREIAGLPGLVFEGVGTHLAEATGSDGNPLQLKDFTRICGELEAAGITGLLRHAAYSSGVPQYPETSLDMVRPGTGVFGFVSPGSPTLEAKLRPAMAWRAAIALLKDFSGVPGPRRVAVLPVGYADGYRRAIRENAQVLIRGRRARVVGSISMNHILVDVTGMDSLAPGTIATLMGEDRGARIDIHELAGWGGVTPAELTTGIGERVGRRYVGEWRPELTV